jgi:hypothetical protein
MNNININSIKAKTSIMEISINYLKKIKKQVVLKTHILEKGKIKCKTNIIKVLMAIHKGSIQIVDQKINILTMLEEIWMKKMLEKCIGKAIVNK